jgi:predicted TPR repeat methyltransferase
MAKLNALLPRDREDLAQYVKRLQYAIHRRISPSVRHRHYLENLVGPIGYWAPLQAYQFEFLKTMGLKPHHSLLDIGCGPLQGGIKLIDYLEPNQYTGIDLRQKTITEAYRQVIEHKLVHKNPALIMSDSFGYRELKDRTFDFFWISQLLYHLSLDQIEALFLQIASQMTETSVLFGDIIDYEPQSGQDAYWHEFKFHRHQPVDLEAMAKKAGLSLTILGQTRDFGYPRELALSKNYILKISPRVPADLSPLRPEDLEEQQIKTVV